ncbi:MAG: hypothetical protein EHM16_07130 [Betaproteobacteria bacterium]|nr:MAG: hypothetical protein EHM16_07130 [Betaproteobacteria bacterium]
MGVGVSLCFLLGFGLGPGVGLRSCFGEGLGLGAGLGFGAGLGLGFRFGRGFLRQLEFGIGCSLGCGTCSGLAFGFSFGTGLGGGARQRIGFDLGFRLGLGAGVGRGPCLRFGLLPGLGFHRRFCRCLRPRLRLSFLVFAGLCLGIDLRYGFRRSEVEVHFLCFHRRRRCGTGTCNTGSDRHCCGRVRRGRKHLDVTARGQIIEDACDILEFELGFLDQFGDRGFAVYRQEKFASSAIQFDDLVLEIKNTFGSLGVDSLRMHGVNTVIYLNIFALPAGGE